MSISASKKSTNSSGVKKFLFPLLASAIDPCYNAGNDFPKIGGIHNEFSYCPVILCVCGCALSACRLPAGGAGAGIYRP
jgi:hypothetical protein